MHAILERVRDLGERADVAAMFVDASLKSVIVLAAAACLVWCCRRSSAATRHLIWLLAVVSVIAMPVLSMIMPAWQRPVWSLRTDTRAGNEMSLTLELAPASGTRATPIAAHGTASAEGIPIRAREGSHQGIAMAFQARWIMIGAVVWAAGGLLALTSFAASHWRVRRLTGRSDRIADTDW